ncbi:2-phospho-L-lactate guanylyltransferase [Rhodococcus sp. NPDC057529]|uniref:2-phospho-L-lactate guanylyltransferase n=1 Tax=Rhodococcus sp. NPDC057529 TaxID=3346158 RepID=UPI00366A9D64
MWSVVVPVKDLMHAKSRLLVGAHRPKLALAFAQDTVAALSRSRDVGVVFVVTEDRTVRETLSSPNVCFLDDPKMGLNQSITESISTVRSLGFGEKVAVVVADLPALRPDDFSAASAIAANFHFSFVADQDGRGTTALFFSDSMAGQPRFGPNSSRAHTLAGSVELDMQGIDGIRRDVDEVEHLEATCELGLGDHTRAALQGIPDIALKPSRTFA